MTKISIRRGTEGPRHDPYSFSEITVTRDTPNFVGSVTFHEGLGVYMDVNCAGIDFRQPDAAKAHVLFTRLAGISPEQAWRAYRELHARRIRYHPCGQKHLIWVDGYPGEELLVCQTCGNVLDSSFSLAAVE